MLSRVLLVALVALLSFVAVVHADGSESSAFGPTTVAVPKVDRHRYLHGQAMGAALEMVLDTKWLQLLTQLMPEIGRQSTAILAEYRAANNASQRSKKAGELMHVLQNNPVLSAYGSVETFKYNCGRSNPELLPNLCAHPGRVEWDIFMSPTNPTDLGAMRITHGGLATTVAQGVMKNVVIAYNRPEVVAAPSALQWMEIFGRAIAANKATPKIFASAAEAQRFGASYMANPGGLVLDVKSTYSTSADLDALVTDLRNRWKINVFGVATFHHPQVDGMRLTNLAKVHFYHSHFGFLNGLAALAPGSQVMFNGGSLLTLRGSAYHVSAADLALVAAAQRSKNLKIGVYTQEHYIGPAAVTGVINMCNQNPVVFSEGYAYGHVNGRAEINSLGNGLGSAGPLLALEKAQYRATQGVAAVRSSVTSAASRAGNAASSALAHIRGAFGN